MGVLIEKHFLVYVIDVDDLLQGQLLHEHCTEQVARVPDNPEQEEVYKQALAALVAIVLVELWK